MKRFRRLAIVFVMLILACFMLPACAQESPSSGGEVIPPEEENNGEEVVLDTFAFDKAHFEDKFVAVYGDSITYGAGTSGPQYTWIHKLGTELGFGYSNLSVSGAMLTYVAAVRDGRGSAAEYVVQNAAVNAVADCAFILMGANDFTHGVSPDFPETEPEQMTDVASYAQGIRWMVKNLRAANPDIEIIFFTPLYRDDVPVNGLGKRISAFGDVITSLAEELVYYYVDLSDVFNSENLGADSIYSADRLHPNDAGQQYLFECILQKKITGYTVRK